MGRSISDRPTINENHTIMMMTTMSYLLLEQPSASLAETADPRDQVTLSPHGHQSLTLVNTFSSDDPDEPRGLTNASARMIAHDFSVVSRVGLG